ncbi:MAG: hypothetical protein WBP45_04450 [Daejeonella sp.]
MTTIKYTTLLMGVLMLTCFSKQNKASENRKQVTINVDTIVISKDLTGQVAGSAYMKRSTGYQICIGIDTSDLMIVLSELKEGGRIYVDFNHYLGRTKKNYRNKMEELKVILPKAKDDYNFADLKTLSVGIGRLASNGDLAIKVTNEYNKKFGKGVKVPMYKMLPIHQKVSDFLLQSTLAKDMNTLFEPYSFVVKRVSVEKVAFMPKKSLYYNSAKIETGPAEVPDKILDCIIGIGLEKKE